jgi:hypothetical protein
MVIECYRLCGIPINTQIGDMFHIHEFFQYNELWQDSHNGDNARILSNNHQG